MTKRDKVVAEAMTWLQTPWHHNARVKGAGVDCAQLLAAVYSEAGVVGEQPLFEYPRDWHLHKEERRFLNYLLQYCDPVDGEPLPGDIAMFQYGRHEAHGAIVLGGGRVLHSWRDEGMVTITEINGTPLEARLRGFYRVRGID